MLMKDIKGSQNKERRITFVFLLMLICSCSHKQELLDPVHYVNWIRNSDNGLNIQKEVGAYEFSVQYKPLPYIVAMEEKTHTLEQKLLNTRITTLGNNFYYFNLKIKSITNTNLSPTGNGVLSEAEYQQRLSYFTFEMQRDLYLIQKQDTLHCSLYQFVRNYDIAPFVEFALGFESIVPLDLNEDITFILDDKILGVGTLKFLFDQSSFQEIPTIKTY